MFLDNILIMMEQSRLQIYTSEKSELAFVRTNKHDKYLLNLVFFLILLFAWKTLYYVAGTLSTEISLVVLFTFLEVTLWHTTNLLFAKK